MKIIKVIDVGAIEVDIWERFLHSKKGIRKLHRCIKNKQEDNLTNRNLHYEKFHARDSRSLYLALDEIYVWPIRALRCKPVLMTNFRRHEARRS